MNAAKYVIKSKHDFQKWIRIGNIFAKSLCPVEEVLKQYNSLSAAQRQNIKKRFLKCDQIRSKKIRKDESISAWEIGIMVDANIIACEYDIDPLTAVLCTNPLCKANEKIIVK